MLSEFAKRKILDQLYLHEKYCQFAYDDATDEIVKAPQGNLTFGIGWNIQVNGCPREIAEFAAMFFVNQRDSELSKKISFYDRLDDVRKVVLCNMAFNMGTGNILEFEHMLSAMKISDWKIAAISMLNSKWAHQVGNRAVMLSKMMESGKWQ